MEITVRVSKDRKHPALLSWKHPDMGIAGWIISFGDSEESITDCEIALSVFALVDLQEMINKLDINSLDLLPEVKTVPKPLNIRVKVAEKDLPRPSVLKSVHLSDLIAAISKDKDRNCWVLNFYDYRVTGPDRANGDFNIWVQIEFSSLQLTELKGMLNTLFARHKREHDAWVKRNKAGRRN